MPAWPVAWALLGLGCADPTPETSATPFPDSGADSSNLATFRARPTVDALLALLEQRHPVGRTRGPYRLAYSATFELNPSADLPPPKVGDRYPQPQKVVDELELRWASAAGEPDRFYLRQANDHLVSREILVDAEKMYTRRQGGGWVVGPLETRHHERRLKEAHRCVFDIVEFAAPNLSVAIRDRPGGAALRIELTRAVDRDEARLPAGAHKRWRQAANIQHVAGYVDLEPSTGRWTAAEIELEYAVNRANAMPLNGRTSLTASIGALDPQHRFPTPSDAEPIPERRRPEVERARLLRGLGGI
ncbi:MAG: hypothetical protein V3V08_20770 [Nannocystaceae bacterium]